MDKSKYRLQIRYLLDRMEESFNDKNKEHEIGFPCYMFIPTYIRTVLNEINETGQIGKEDLYDVIRIIEVLNKANSEEIRGLSLSMQQMIKRECTGSRDDFEELSMEEKRKLDSYAGMLL